VLPSFESALRVSAYQHWQSTEAWCWNSGTDLDARMLC